MAPDDLSNRASTSTSYPWPKLSPDCSRTMVPRSQVLAEGVMKPLQIVVCFFPYVVCFVRWSVLSRSVLSLVCYVPGLFCPMVCFVQVCFVIGLLCPWSVLSAGLFCPGLFCHWSVLSGVCFVRGSVMSRSVLSGVCFVRGLFCPGGLFCPVVCYVRSPTVFDNSYFQHVAMWLRVHVYS
jgi:hypothetical protein